MVIKMKKLTFLALLMGCTAIDKTEHEALIASLKGSVDDSGSTLDTSSDPEDTSTEPEFENSLARLQPWGVCQNSSHM